MVISQASECAIRAMFYLASFPADQVITKREICRTQEITPGFLIKIMQPLIANGLVKSYRGVAGGFILNKPPEYISMLDIISAVEGPILLNKCMIHQGYCPRDKTCAAHLVWSEAKRDLERTLSEATLAQLLKTQKKGIIQFI